MRASVVEALGGICVRCGFSDKRALQVDHINGGGHQEVMRFGSYYLMIGYYLQHLDEAKTKLQILCANCNWIKKHKNNELSGPKRRYH